MRKIVNISLSEGLVLEVEKAMKTGEYASKSEFFRELLRIWKEERLLKKLQKSQKEIALGKGKTLKHLRDRR